MKNIDLRLAALLTLWKKQEKQVLSEDVKNAIRNNDYTTTFNDYANIKLKDYTSSNYSKEDQARIDNFIKDNHIEKIKSTKANYSIEIVPSQKAIAQFQTMLNDLEQSEHRNIAKVASQIKNSK